MTTQTPTLNTWTHPTTGEVRYYLNNWESLAGIEVHRYDTGNVSSFHINGEKVANGRYGRYSGKIWVSETGEVHIDLSRAFYTSELIDAEKLQADLRDAALKLWNEKYAPKAEEVAEETPAEEPEVSAEWEQELRSTISAAKAEAILASPEATAVLIDAEKRFEPQYKEGYAKAKKILGTRGVLAVWQFQPGK